MRHLRPARWLFAHCAVTAVIVALVGDQGGVAAEPPPQLKSASSAVPAGAGAATDAVLASWSGGAVHARDWLAAYAVKTPLEQRTYDTSAGRVQLLRELERYALLVQEAERRGYDKHVLVVDAAQKAAIDALTAKELAIAPEAISNADVAAEYEAKRNNFRKPAVRRASQIVVASEAEAKALLRELRGVSRERFGEVARERSIDDTGRKQSGELGWFTREGRGADGNAKSMPTELVTTTWQLPKVGALSRPLKVERGYALLLLTGEEAEMVMPYDEAAGELREQLAIKRSQQRVEELVMQLRASVPIEVHPELLAPIALDTESGLDIPQGFPAHPPDPRVGARTIKPDKF